MRQLGVVGKFVEFFGPGVTELSIADRATISNMCPEYGATIGYFPVDSNSLSYLRQTSESCSEVILNPAFMTFLQIVLRIKSKLLKNIYELRNNSETMPMHLKIHITHRFDDLPDIEFLVKNSKVTKFNIFF